MDSWAARSTFIQSNIGEVQRIAPIGFNHYQGGFTDGANAKMNLEVVGERGKGILHLPYVEIFSDGQLNNIGADATWTCNGKTEVIVKSGKSYLAHFGLEDGYRDLMDLAGAGDHDSFLNAWDKFQIAVDQCPLPTPRYRNDELQPIDGLRDEYREPLLERRADMLSSIGKSEEAAETYRIAAETKLQRAKDTLQKTDDERDMAQIACDLSAANRMLKLANEQVPDDERTIDLARYRVELWYLHSIGSRRSAEIVWGDEDDDQRAEQAWAEKSLGILYTESSRWAQESPYLNGQVPRMKVSIYRGGDNRMRVNDHNCYSADVYLTLSNRRMSGTLYVRIRENEDRHQPVDLFAETPRGPDYPLRTRSPYWEPEGGKRIKLSAKTGEPMRKN
jgi:hypothetical protein